MLFIGIISISISRKLRSTMLCLVDGTSSTIPIVSSHVLVEDTFNVIEVAS